MEVEVVSRISQERVRRSYWKNIIFNFGLPEIIVSNNSMQFASSTVIEVCRNIDIQNQFVSVEHPQANDQAEEGYESILSGMKEKLDEAKEL